MAHRYMYHILKASFFRKAISHNFRKRRRNYPVLLLSGARLEESNNRKKNLTNIWNIDPSAKNNIWVNLIHHWTGRECNRFLAERETRRNPVTLKLCRSGECLCGTMQAKDIEEETRFFYPEWGKWLDECRDIARRGGFRDWDWADEIPQFVAQMATGQIHLPFGSEFMPACTSCIAKRKSND